MHKENIIRITSNIINNFLKKNNIYSKFVGYYYVFIHYTILILSAIIILFNNNPFHLTILLIVLSLDAFSIVVLHNCPLTILEQKYLKNSLAKKRIKHLKKSKIVYKCNHMYEQQLELLINVWILIACKILFILSIQTINKKKILELINLQC
jgi:hypothetical protein